MKVTKLILSRGDLFENPITLVNADLPDRPLIYTNQLFRDSTKYDEASIIGKNCRFLQGAKTDYNAVQRVKNACNTHEPICQDLINYTFTGELFYNRLVLIPFKEQGINYVIGLQHVIPEEMFRPDHQADRPNLLDKTINPLAVMVALLINPPEDLEPQLKKATRRIKEFVLSL